MKLYIVIDIIHLCEKPDSVDFPRKNHQVFSNDDSINGNRNFRSQKFVRLGHVQNFNKTRHFSFSVYLSFVWDFEDAQVFYSEMKLYIVIDIIHLCEKPDSVDFPRKNHQVFLYKNVF